MKKCEYCGKCGTSKEMTQIPQDEKDQRRKRKEYLSESEKNGFFCISHFELDKYGRKSIKKPDLEENMPIGFDAINLYFVRLDHNYCKDFENVEILPIIPSQKKPEQVTGLDLRRCCYCEKSMNRKHMTRVPTGKDRRAKWSNTLGAQFEYNIWLKSDGYICLSHFELDEQGKRKDMSDPRADLNLNLNSNSNSEQEIPIRTSTLRSIPKYKIGHDHSYCKKWELPDENNSK